MATRDGFVVEEERVCGGEDDHGDDVKKSEERHREIERARAMADGATSDMIDDCCIDRKRNDCKFEVVRWRRCHPRRRQQQKRQ